MARAQIQPPEMVASRHCARTGRESLNSAGDSRSWSRSPPFAHRSEWFHGRCCFLATPACPTSVPAWGSALSPGIRDHPDTSSAVLLRSDWKLQIADHPGAGMRGCRDLLGLGTAAKAAVEGIVFGRRCTRLPRLEVRDQSGTHLVGWREARRLVRRGETRCAYLRPRP
jgi:hypothetical protein